MQPFGFESQMIVGESMGALAEPAGMAAPWDNHGDSGQPINITWNRRTAGTASIRLTSADPFHGQASMKLELQSGSSAAVSNRGAGNQGLVFRGGKDYTGYIFARAKTATAADPAASAVSLTVALHDITDRSAQPKVLASVQLLVHSANWTKYEFTLVPNGSTGCVFIPFGSDPDIQCFAGGCKPPSKNWPGCNPATPPPSLGAGHACQRCGGEISFGLSEPGSVEVDFAALHPGDWGRFAGLEVRRDAVKDCCQR